ncbi:hypothetical protein C8J55DRAFT_490286 [Lentinula edodes]|uniref:Uncharacterized protein n=1 Tax=Lentinula lateritia TaxID=40482 RepID=A0A9W9A8B4_9AGAR|nr:uncharacterized protein C8R40DRAFT_1067359 [Lentinula edodes]KAH7878338.1 hypothetical protein C8R40DRAFT_1067359 [Lentinula edodes]KAJ4476014.1 hypothetical protein C8J55DRAFT_490286 [Lentinula edodes]
MELLCRTICVPPICRSLSSVPHAEKFCPSSLKQAYICSVNNRVRNLCLLRFGIWSQTFTLDDDALRKLAPSVLQFEGPNRFLPKYVLTSPTKANLPLPPLAPVNKSNLQRRPASLLDTQAHLQNLGQVVDDLTSKVDNAKHEIFMVKTLLQQEREVL